MSREGENPTGPTADAHSIAGDCATIVHRLEQRRLYHPDLPLIHFLPEGEAISGSLTAGRLWARAQTIAEELRQHASPGDRALLVYPPGLEFVGALLGCLAAGVIAVPCRPPEWYGGDRFDSLTGIANDCGPRLLLTSGKGAERMQAEGLSHPALARCEVLVTEALPDGDDVAGRKIDIDPQATAFLQYTSGSTGRPKGVVVSHGNIVANIIAMERAFLGGSSAGVSWLPMYHDMGLVGTILPAVWTGVPLYLLPPTLMLKHPDRWLRTISRFRADISPSPNFAFDYCVRRVTAGQKATLDLSCWKVACIGAEPVRPETLRRFSEAFAGCGFRPETFYPCYGLAEATLFVTGGAVDAPPVVRRIARPTSPPTELVSCGQAASGLEIAIVDPDTRLPCREGAIGEIWIKGPSVAQGYWNREEESLAVFGGRRADHDAGPYLRTGDLGLIQEAELLIAGRIKDVIILRGQNVYPADLEATVVRSHPAFQGALGAAFGCEVGGEEQLVVLQELDRRATCEDRSVLIEAIHATLSEQHQLRAHDVRLVRIGTLPKTTSGKIRRGECRARYLSNSLTPSE